MALDDFAPASEIPEPNPDSPLAKAGEADEDLFNFPAAAPEAGPEAPAADAESGEDLMADPPAKAEPVKTEIECTGLDPELDVDVFDFPPLDLSSLGVEEPEAPLEETIEAATQSVHALLQDDLGDSTNLELDAPHFDDDLEDLPSAAAQATAAPQSQEFAPHTGPQPNQPQAIATPVHVAVPAGGGSSKALWVMTAGLLVFLFGLLAIAWRATSSFQQQIEQVRAEVTTNTAEIQRETADELERIVAMQGQLLRGAGQGVDEPQLIPAMESPAATVMTVAQEAIEQGRFADARRMLFTLLAEADRYPAESREEMERHAGFLIAASHKHEAQTLPEDVQ